MARPAVAAAASAGAARPATQIQRTHQRVKAFVVDGLGDLRNITGHLSTLAGVKLHTSDLSMVVHRDTIMFHNIAAKFPELDNLKSMKIIWN